MTSLISDAAGLPAPSRHWALFLDFDGTIAEIAEAPHLVALDPEMIPILRGVVAELAGAVAVITGRTSADLDSFMAPLTMAAAGIHGLERRLPGENAVTRLDPPRIDAVKSRLAAFAAARPGVVFEDKGPAATLHYRQAPAAENDILALVASLCQGLDGYHVMHGKCVVEIKSDMADKGSAIEALMQYAPFRGRRPVFIGDDITDEDGFRVVNTMGGFGVKVGNGNSAAGYAVKDVQTVHEWLRMMPGLLAE